MKFLPLSQGKVAIIDDADFKKVGHFKWHAQKTPSGNFYVVRQVPGGKYRTPLYLHTALLGIKGVDHRNGNGLDCRRENLRGASPKQQNRAFQRKRKGTTSKFRGVSWDARRSMWQAKICVGARCFWLGYFQIEKIAARNYDKKATELGFFKEALNFPDL